MFRALLSLSTFIPPDAEQHKGDESQHADYAPDGCTGRYAFV